MKANVLSPSSARGPGEDDRAHRGDDGLIIIDTGLEQTMATVIGAYHYSWSNEDDLQRGIALALDVVGIARPRLWTVHRRPSCQTATGARP